MCYAATMETKPTQRERQLENRVVKLEISVADITDQLTMMALHLQKLNLPLPKPEA